VQLLYHKLLFDQNRVDELYYLLLKGKPFLAQPDASEYPCIVNVKLVTGFCDASLIIDGCCLLLILADAKNFE
jgi:hypothetical protein